MTTATKFWTWSEIYAGLVEQLDLENEDIVDEAEMMAYANEAIDEAEGIINSLNEEYFLMRTALVLTTADTYSLPSTIYANKIRSIIHYNGTDVYEIVRIPTLRKFLEYRLARANGETASTSQLMYFIINATAGTPQIVFTPTPVASTCEIWHYRQANRMLASATVCDLPECVRFIFDYCHERFAWKQAAGSARHQTAIKRIEDTKQQMMVKLKPGVVDGNDEIEGDFSVYEEHN